jgi:hypothetical protein
MRSAPTDAMATAPGIQGSVDMGVKYAREIRSALTRHDRHGTGNDCAASSPPSSTPWNIEAASGGMTPPASVAHHYRCGFACHHTDVPQLDRILPRLDGGAASHVILEADAPIRCASPTGCSR